MGESSAKFLSPKLPKIWQGIKLVFGVADIHAARATLLARGVQLQEVFSAASGVWVCHGVDGEGNPPVLETYEQ